MRLPSRLKAGSRSAAGWSVRRTGFVASLFMMNISLLPSRVDEKATRPPSGTSGQEFIYIEHAVVVVIRVAGIAGTIIVSVQLICVRSLRTIIRFVGNSVVVFVSLEASLCCYCPRQPGWVCFSGNCRRHHLNHRRQRRQVGGQKVGPSSVAHYGASRETSLPLTFIAKISKFPSRSDENAIGLLSELNAVVKSILDC